MKYRKVSLMLVLFVVLGLSVFFILKGISLFGNNIKGKSSGITAAEREKWIASITPVYTPSKKVVMGKMDNNPAILVNNVPLPSITSYFGYLFNEWGLVMKPDVKFHEKHIERLARAGVNIHQIGVILDLPEGKVIIEDKKAADILRCQPDAKFLFRVVFLTRPEFYKQYPDDAVIWNDGTTGVWNSPGHALTNDPKLPRYSFASLNWERVAAQGVVNLAAAISKLEYKDKVLGAVLGAGNVGQWLWWSDFDYENICIDFSPVMHQRFVEYLKDKYKTDSALQKAWHDKKVTFATVKIPTKEERGVDVPNSVNDIPPNNFEGGFGYFRNPDTSNNQKVVDYYTSMSLELGRRLMYLCQAFKKATNNSLLVGAFYGPISVLGYKIEGQSYFSEVLNSEWVDFFCSPWSYQGRWEGEPVFINGPMSSLLLRNKTYIVECDLRTSDLGRRELGSPLDPWGDLMNIRKSFIRLITYNAYGYWFEMEFDGWFENEKIFQGFKEASDISKLAMSLDRGRNAEIAVIYDGESLLYGAEWLDYAAIIRQTIQGLGYMGTDYDSYSTDDIARPELSKYKLFIFPNAFMLKDKTRQEIKQHLQKDGKVILWSYASGLINTDRSPALSMANMEELTGIKFGYVDYKGGKKDARMKVIKADGITQGFSAGDVIGDFLRPVTLDSRPPENPWKADPLQTHPQIYADDSKAETFAVFTDTGKPGFVVKEMDGWTSIYSGSVAVPSKVLRNIAKKAKVHLYTDTDDIVYANNSLLGIHLATEGKKQIKLPAKMDVYDLFEKRLIGKDIDKFEISVPNHSTVLFFTGDYDDLNKLLTK